MGDLWFENSYGEKRVIANCATRRDAINAINAFVRTCNKNKPAGSKPFEIYYMRCWEVDDGMIKIDVGSHTEFFYIDKTTFGEIQ